jgi:hypothetical protein
MHVAVIELLQLRRSSKFGQRRAAPLALRPITAAPAATADVPKNLRRVIRITTNPLSL